MKKIVGFMVALVFSVGIANADASAIKNFNGYKIVGQNIRQVTPAVEEAMYSAEDVHKISNIESAWYYTNKNKETYYLRFYPANKDTNVYIVANEEYSKTDNEITKFCQKMGYKLEELKDKDALREYKFDFYDLARKNQLGGFFISPDCIKPLKVGMSKINEKMSKNSKKNAVIPYSEDNEPIDLTLVDSRTYEDLVSQVGVTVNEYRLKQKANKYVHAFEYLVKNNSSSDITVNEVTCERLASTKDIATETFVDLDRLDLLDTVGTFPPVLIATAGTSALCSIPNWVRLARTTAEATRFAKALPSNYVIKPGKTMRILCLKYKDNKKPLIFTFNRNGEIYKISF